MKKILAIFITILILCSFIATIGAGAQTTSADCVYFQTPIASGIAWNNFKNVYCHIWEIGGEPIYSWQAKEEKCEDMGNGYYSYNLSGTEFNPDASYAVIFSNENGLQTYDLYITSACKGDIVVCNGDTCTNPVDGEKTCTVARWLNNANNVFPVAQVGSDGLNVDPDGIIDKEIDTKWGDAEGTSMELPELEDKTQTATEITDETSIEETNAEIDANKNVIATIEKETDKDNPNNMLLWLIIGLSTLVCIAVIIAIVIVKANKKK